MIMQVSGTRPFGVNATCWSREKRKRGSGTEKQNRFLTPLAQLLDEESLLATCAYIDLNPVAAGIAKVPEASAHTSIKQRVEHVPVRGVCQCVVSDFVFGFKDSMTLSLYIIT